MRRKIGPILLTSILFLIMFTHTAPVGHSINWSPEMRFTWKTGMDWLPSATQTSDGRIWVVWQSDRTGNSQIFYKIYNQSAVHPWSSDMQLTNNKNEDFTPSIMQAQNGTIWVVWASNRTGNGDIYYKTYNGSAWSTDKPLILDPSSDMQPCIIQTRNGTIWVAWSSNRLDTTYHIYYQTSSDGGRSWTSPPTQLTDRPSGGDIQPSLTQAQNLTVWAVWQGDGDLYYQLYNGTSWLYPIDDPPRLTTNPYMDANPSIAQATNGAIWVVWHAMSVEEGDKNIFYDIYTTSWSGPTQLTTDLSDDLGASVLGAADGTIWIFWASTRMDSFDLYYETNSVPAPHDVSIFSVEPSETVAVQGKNTTIEVVAQNKGTNQENFVVNCYAGPILIGTRTVIVVPGQLNVTRFQWNTSAVPLGTYTMRGEAILAGDYYNLDNTYTDGTITIVKHDVAIVSVTPSETVAQRGYKLSVSVVIKNKGNFTEAVTVTAYYNLSAIGTQTRTELVPSGEITLVFDWKPTSSCPYGNYTIKAIANRVPDEFNLGDNSKTDGTVLVTIPGDVDGHRSVNLADLLLINNSVHSGTYSTNVDIQNDGKIDVSDLAILGHNWGKSW